MIAGRRTPYKTRRAQPLYTLPMSIEDEEDLRGLMHIGHIVAEALRAMERATEAGATTADLDAVAAEVLRKHRARSTPRRAYDFPGYACVSVNEEAVHGVPGKRKLFEGDVVKLDVTADYGGFVADAARTVVVGRQSGLGVRLANAARTAFDEALDVARVGGETRDIGRVVDKAVKRRGFSVIRELFGHGIGRSVHEPPSVPSYDEPRCIDKLTDGLVITIEPIIAAGRPTVKNLKDGWTLATRDKSLTAHFEQTIVITKGKPIIVTGS